MERSNGGGGVASGAVHAYYPLGHVSFLGLLSKGSLPLQILGYLHRLRRVVQHLMLLSTLLPLTYTSPCCGLFTDSVHSFGSPQELHTLPCYSILPKS